MQCLVSFLVLQSLAESEGADCFVLIAVLLQYGWWCSVSLPCGGVGWSAVCDCDITWSYTSTF